MTRFRLLSCFLVKISILMRKSNDDSMQSSCNLKAQTHSGIVLAVLELHCVIITTLHTQRAVSRAMLLQPGCMVLLHLQLAYRGCWVHVRRTFQKRMSLITPHYYTSNFFSKKAVMLGKLSENSGSQPPSRVAQEHKDSTKRGAQTSSREPG